MSPAEQALFAKEYGGVKYAKVGSEIRLCHGDTDHKSMVTEGEQASSAGFIQYDTGKFRISNSGSMTLGIGPDPLADGVLIAEKIGMEFIPPK